MHCHRPPEALRAAIVLACSLAVTTPAGADERWLLQGLLDAELFETDDGSRLLSRNDGETAAGGRIRVWAASELHPRLHGFAMGGVEQGTAYDDDGTATELLQAFVRATLGSDHPWYLEAGRIPQPLGNFSARYFSNVNPLIGEPDSYTIADPLGIQLIGAAGRADFRVGIVDLPLINERYLPEAGSSPRPIAAAGITPLQGLRIGAYYTAGAYLHEDLTPLLPPGADWEEFDQRITGLDFSFSSGHFEINADYNRSQYDVPTHPESVDGGAWYIEPKYTWTPRFYTALRFERNLYAFIRPIDSTNWMGSEIEFHDIEIGAGVRFGPDTLLKVSYRRDRWNVDDALKRILPDGHSVAMQLSHTFDVRSWARRPL